MQLFDLETLNSRLKCFNYGDLENSYKPFKITNEALIKKLQMSASEMLFFSRYLGFLIVDLVPADLPIWEGYISLREIVDIVTAPALQFTESVRLKCIIEEHHELYIKFFGALKPKHHILTHYPTIFDKCGPFVHYWVMRSEQKHNLNLQLMSVNFKTSYILSQLSLS